MTYDASEAHYDSTSFTPSSIVPDLNYQYNFSYLQMAGTTEYLNVFVNGVAFGFGTPEPLYGLEAGCWIPALGFSWHE